MAVTIRLLGRAAVERDGRSVAGPRGHKAWGLLAYLALAEVAPSRQRLVSLLFDEADDPRRALRWNLAELRRALAGIVTVDGDPVVLELAPGHQIDVDLLTGGGRPASSLVSEGVSPVDLAALGGELLEGMPFTDSPAFEAWLAAERQRLAADARRLVYESALRLLAAGQPTTAARLAARAVELDPLDADHHTVLVTALVRAGDLDGARQQVARCTDLFRRELGVDPPPDVERAARPASPSPLTVARDPVAPDDLPTTPDVRGAGDPAAGSSTAAALPAGTDPRLPSSTPGQDVTGAGHEVPAAAPPGTPNHDAGAPALSAAPGVAGQHGSVAGSDAGAPGLAGAGVAGRRGSVAGSDAGARDGVGEHGSVAGSDAGAPGLFGAPGVADQRGSVAGSGAGGSGVAGARGGVGVVGAASSAVESFGGSDEGDGDGGDGGGGDRERTATVVRPLVPPAPAVVSAAAVRSYLDAGRASIAAGAIPSGIDRLGRAVAVAEVVGDVRLLGAAQLELAGALIHSNGGRGAEVTALLHQALVAAERAGDAGTAAAACRELGFLGVQLGHRQSAEHWLARAEAHCAGVDDQERAKVLGVRGQSLTDAAAYPAALEMLGASLELAQRAGARRQEGWALSMIGRVHVLRDEPALAVTVLDRALELVREQRWTAFLPWPETFRAEAALAIGDTTTAGDLLDHAWILATETQDHCWIVAVAHGLARLAAVAGDHERALRWCETGLRPRAWYLWPRARLLDAGCEVAAPHAPDLARRWAAELTEIAARGAMHELTARARRHLSRLGDDQVLGAARTAAEDIDNPSLHRLLDADTKGAVA